MATLSSAPNENQSDECKTKQQLVVAEKYRRMFEYSLSKPRFPVTTEWSSKRGIRHKQELIKYPFRMEWNDTNELENVNNDSKDIESHVKRRRIYY